MTKGLSRRKFLQGVGVGTGAALVAGMGLSGVRAADIRTLGLLQQAGAASTLTPDVELLCGDVVGFQLTSDQWEGAFGSVTFQIHRALYDGDFAYYIRTDASDQTFAAENRLVHVPLLNAALSAEGATSKLYTFTNPVEGQLPVINHTPEDEAYSPAWHVHHVTFSGTSSLLDSEQAILDAESAGDVTIEAQQLVVNYPLVKWPGGELPVDTELNSYLGTGPLISAPNTDDMRVTFKLHECYPGSRYIVTDTSAVPMAPMMGIAPSAPTQQLANVGAIDEIWVFGNGIPGSGVMGFQPAIFDNSAGSPVWSPFWHHFTAVWTDESQARLLTSSAEIRELEASGELQIFKGVPDMDQSMPAFVVNCPVPIKARNTFQPAS